MERSNAKMTKGIEKDVLSASLGVNGWSPQMRRQLEMAFITVTAWFNKSMNCASVTSLWAKYS
eukprot:208189-Amphidinium_carterae.2